MNGRVDYRGQKVTLADHCAHPQFEIAGVEILVEDYWDTLTGGSWMFCKGNPAAMIYGLRIGFADYDVPVDNEVLYGKHPNGLGLLFHVSEIAE